MRNPPPRSAEIEALLAPHRAVMPLAPSVEARAVARAAAVSESPEPAAVHVPGPPRWVFAAAAGIVVALGAAAYAARVWRDWPESPRRVVDSPTATEPRPRTVAAPVPETEAPAAIAPPAAPMRRIASKANATTMRPTNAELQLLRLARQDLTRSDFAGALAAIGEHVRRFPNGSLVEEREALRVKSLAGLGRLDDAQRAAAEFHAHFPHSVLLSTFERMREPDR